MKLFLTVALSLTAIALVAHAQQYAPPNYPPPPGPPSAGYSAPQPPAAEMIPPPPPAQQAVTPPMAMPAQAQIEGPPALQPQQQGNVAFISGGASGDDRDALKAVESQYNVRLLFAAKNGDYLANVAVTLSDTRGNATLDTIAEGPIFYAHVPPGRYRLTVSNEGQSQSRDINVGTGGAVSQDFYWASAS